MQRKRLAVVLSQAEHTYHNNLLIGLLQEAFLDNLDVCVFTTFIKEGTPDVYQLGESNIFNLLNPEQFDGLILVPDSIKFPGVTKKIVSECRAHRLPVVTVDYQIEDLPCIWGSDDDDIEQLVDHLIDVHGCKTVDFISGRKNHPHSLRREAGYIRSLRKHGIPVETERIHYADFGREKAAEIADDILHSGRPLPQGIAGVCDSSIEAIAEVFIEKGYRIPEDFRLSGYDTLCPIPAVIGEVTTMYRNSGLTGVKAVRCLYRILFGTEPAHPIVSNRNDIITSASCGCGITDKQHNFHCNNRIDNLSVIANDFYSDYNFMMEDLIKIDRYDEFFWNINWYVRYLNQPDGVYFCINDEWRTEDETAENNYRTTGYPQQMSMVYSLENGTPSVDPANIIDTKLMLPRLYQESDKPSVYYFTPLHFNDRCFGYTVLQYTDRAEVFNEEYASWMRYIDNAFEAMRRRLRLKYLYERQERLQAFSVTDALTGIYNRNGYSSIGVNMFQTARKEHQPVFVMVGDMNNLKTINDTYGHIDGDESIRATATAMQSACEREEKCFRIGGDEFVILGVGAYTEDAITQKLQKIETAMKAHNQQSQKPYEISISLGYVYTSAADFDSIEDAVSVADERMFANKQAYKQGAAAP